MARNKKNITISVNARDNASKKLTGMQKAWRNLKLAGIAIATTAIVAFTAAMRKGMQFAAEQERVVKNLTSSMQNNGTYTREAAMRALDFADQMQKLTTFTNEQTIDAMARLNAHTGQTGEELEKATQAAADLAARTGMDLTQAADLVGKTLSGTTNQLSRYGIQVDGAANSTERLDTLVDGISAKFGGSAAAQAETYEGKVKQMKNAWDDLLKTMATGVNQQFQPFVEWLTRVFETLTQKIPTFVRNFLNGFAAMQASLGFVRVAITELVNAFMGMVDNIQIGHERMVSGLRQAALRIKGIFKNTEEEREKIRRESEEKIADLEKKRANRELKAAQYRESVIKDFTARIERNERNMQERSTNEYHINLAEKTSALAESVAEQEEILEEAHEAELDRIDEKLEAEEQLTDAREEALQRRLESELTAAESLEDANKAIANSIFQTVKERLIAEMFAGQIAEMAKIGTSIAGHLATLNFPAAALAASQLAVPAIQTAAGVAAINAITPKFHTGGIIPGSGDQPIMGKGGEAVLTTSQQKRLLEIADGGGSSTINIPVYLDGKQIAQVVTTHQKANERRKT